jgi:MarR family transcriptional regulator, organic hydroperoxide resistance regulator
MTKRNSERLPKNPGPTQEILRFWKHTNPQERLSHLIGDATRILTRALQMRLSKYGVSIGHWRFFRVLWERGPMTQSELSSWAGVMASTTSTALRSMEELGYIIRRHEPGNRKTVVVSLTEEGARMRDLLTPLALEVNRIALRKIADADVAVARRVLLSIIEEGAKDEEAFANAGQRMLSTRELGRTFKRSNEVGRKRRPVSSVAKNRKNA